MRSFLRGWLWPGETAHPLDTGPVNSAKPLAGSERRAKRPAAPFFARTSPVILTGSCGGGPHIATDLEGMGKKLYVGNLNFRTSDDGLADAFAARGFPVVSCKIIVDRETGRSRGFAFVEFAADDQADAALASMHDHDVDGRQIKVTEARAKSDGPGPRGGFEGGARGYTSGPRGGDYGRGGYDRPHGSSHQGAAAAQPNGGVEGPPSRGSYEGPGRGAPRGGAGGREPSFAGRPDERPSRPTGGEAGRGYRSFEPRGPRPGGFGGPPAGAPPFGAEEPSGGRRGRGERRDLRKQHERQDDGFDEDDDY